jgi:hypothetical protein
MNRRQFFRVTLSTSALFIGSDTEQEPSTAALLNNSEVQDALKSLADAIDKRNRRG